MEEESACWICLEGASAERGQLARPCNCPRDVHLRCLSRWCLQQAGRSEERACRFCKSNLPDWKAVLTGPAPPSCDPIMVVTLGQVVHKIRVKPGEEGRRLFQQEIRRLFNIPSGVDFEVTFRCKAPCTSETIQLEGMSSYHAATHCASLMAAQRLAAAGPQGAASSLPAAAMPDGATSSSTQPAVMTTPQQAERSSNSGLAAPPQQGTTLRQRLGTGLRRALSAFQGNSSTGIPAPRTHNPTAVPAAQSSMPSSIPAPVNYPQVVAPAVVPAAPSTQPIWQAVPRVPRSMPSWSRPFGELENMYCDDTEVSQGSNSDRRMRTQRSRRTKRPGSSSPTADASASRPGWGPFDSTLGPALLDQGLASTSRMAFDSAAMPNTSCPAIPEAMPVDTGSAQLLASSTGSAMMLLDDDHHLTTLQPASAGDSLAHAQDLAAAAKEAVGAYVMGSTQPLPVRRSPRNHQLGTWAQHH